MEGRLGMALDRQRTAGWAVHPGEILDEEFLKPLSISQYRLAKEIGVPSQAVNDIVRRKRGISADMALRLGRFFATSAEFWLNLQVAFDIHNIAKEAKKKIEKIRPYRTAA
jgi:addiction module HigA family antidote